MKTFYIYANKVTVDQARGRGLKVSPNNEKFRTERELAALAAQWPASRLLEIWNALPCTRPVRRFTDRKTAVRRIWNQVRKLQSVSSLRKRTDTKKDQIIALLHQPSGATLSSIMAATGWQAHSVRGFVSGHLINKMHLRVKSFRQGGERVYAIQS